jgi:hypothetical protein
VRADLEIADIFRAARSACRATYAVHLFLHQLKVMSAIEHCRTAALGGHVEACAGCGQWRIAYDSCRNLCRLRIWFTADWQTSFCCSLGMADEER